MVTVTSGWVNNLAAEEEEEEEFASAALFFSLISSIDFTPVDATEGVTEQDAKIAGIAHDRGKGIIIAVNKWDAIEKDNNTVKKHTEKIRQILSFMPYAEILFISAKSGQRLNKIFEMIDVVI